MVLPSLQTLHLYIHLTHTRRSMTTRLVDCHQLEAITGNLIESIKITMTVQTDAGIKTNDEWAPLDRALTQNRSGWPKLRSVIIKIDVIVDIELVRRHRH